MWLFREGELFSGIWIYTYGRAAAVVNIKIIELAPVYIFITREPLRIADVCGYVYSCVCAFEKSRIFLYRTFSGFELARMCIYASRYKHFLVTRIRSARSAVFAGTFEIKRASRVIFLFYPIGSRIVSSVETVREKERNVIHERGKIRKVDATKSFFCSLSILIDLLSISLVNV